MSDAWSERLSEYLDGDLAAEEAAALDAHLRECPECRHEVAELRRVTARLSADSIRPSDQPSHREWRSIRRSIGAPRGRRLIPVAIAAALAGLIAAGALLRPSPRAPMEAVLAAAPAAYTQATTDLEAVLREHHSRLLPETVQALAASLAVIDTALAQAEQALRADPANEYIARSMGTLRESRLTVLRRAVSVATSKEL
jgi:anti-sigma factor RsiW